MCLVVLDSVMRFLVEFVQEPRRFAKALRVFLEVAARRKYFGPNGLLH